MRLLMVSAAVSAGLLVPALPASAASTSGPAARWSEVPAGRPTAGTALSGVVAVGATNRWAVGSVTAPGTVRPLVEHDSGYGWRRVPVPDVGATGGRLHGVAAVTAHDIWAVGDTAGAPLALHFNGTAWRSVPTAPEPPGGTLLAVAAASADDVWAVGSQPTGDGPGILVEHWDGRRWADVPAPGQPPTDVNALSGLAVVSARDVWAVGSRGDDFDEPLVEHWDGTAWRVVDVPEPPQPDPDNPHGVGLTAVTAVSATDVWAVGEAGLIEHYDGRQWTIATGPAVDVRWAAVSARGGADVWAVGTSTGSPRSAHWDGHAWRTVPVPGTGSLDGVVAARSGGTTAVGSAGARALIVHHPR